MNHLNRIVAQLDAYELDALCVTSEPGEFYTVGMKGEGLALVTRQGCYYFTDARYIELAQRTVTNAEVTMVTPHQDHLALASLLLVHHQWKRVGIEEQYLTVERWQKMQTAFPAGTELIPAGKLLTELRGAKTPEEVAIMQTAQDITDQVFAEICQFIRAGVTESEVAAQLTYLQMKHGAEGNSFPPIVASGANGSMPHAIPTAKPIQAGEFVTMDFGCVYGGYCSDMTRTVAVGTPSDEMRRVYDAVLEAQLAGIAVAKAGVPGCVIHNTAWDVLKKYGYGDYFGHGFGHSLGLEIHESPNANRANTNPLPAGAVLSAEPGVYLPEKFGVRIEDVICLTETGNHILTHAVKDLIIL